MLRFVGIALWIRASNITASCGREVHFERAAVITSQALLQKILSCQSCLANGSYPLLTSQYTIQNLMLPKCSTGTCKYHLQVASSRNNNLSMDNVVRPTTAYAGLESTASPWEDCQGPTFRRNSDAFMVFLGCLPDKCTRVYRPSLHHMDVEKKISHMGHPQRSYKLTFTRATKKKRFLTSVNAVGLPRHCHDWQM